MKHKCTGAPLYKEASKANKMEKILTSEEKKQIDELLRKNRPQPEEKKTEGQRETTVTSKKGTKIVVKSEIVEHHPSHLKTDP